MSDVVFIELPQVGAQVSFMQPFGVIESVKAVSDLFAPVSGTVLEVNTALANTPEIVNSDPYGQGWIVLVKPKDPGELQKLMTAEQYRKVVGEVNA
jgi:glycine cleavage system H protein